MGIDRASFLHILPKHGLDSRSRLSRKRLAQVMTAKKAIVWQWDFLLWAAALWVFSGAIWWLAEATVQRGQLAHAGIVLCFGMFALLSDRPTGSRLSLTFDAVSLGLLISACVVAAGAGLWQVPWLMALALGLLAVAAIVFVFGERVMPTAVGFGLAFSGFTLFAIVLPFLDWPLRLFAGKTAIWILEAMGSAAQLGFGADRSKLILMSAGRPFEVAAECNGFGLISGCVLLAVLLVFSLRLRLFDKVLSLLLAPLLGLLANALRIVLIVLLAPFVGEHYFLMHEAVGISLFLGTLMLLWWLLRGLSHRAVAPLREDPVPG